MGVAYVKAVQSYGVAASIKHFPGDGCDERDQHLVTSVNDRTVEEWDATYGAAYKAGIDAGAMTVMVGHIMQPAYSRALRPGIADADILPASLAPELMGDLLRGKLGFNGLVVTDATTMAGFTIPMPRSKAVPASIAAGADVFLFTRNLEEDYGFMAAGVQDGTITPERLDDAVMRILALKAALKLHERALPTLEGARAVVGNAEHVAWSKECADKAITLVKEQPGVLPLTPDRYKKILFCPIEASQGFAYSVRAGVCDMVREKLVAEGFEVDIFTPKNFFEGQTEKTSDYIGVYDAIIYVANLSTKSNQTTCASSGHSPWVRTAPVTSPRSRRSSCRSRTRITSSTSPSEDVHQLYNSTTTPWTRSWRSSSVGRRSRARALSMPSAASGTPTCELPGHRLRSRRCDLPHGQVPLPRVEGARR